MTTANKNEGKKSVINKYMRNPTDIKLCISYKKYKKGHLHEVHLLKITVLIKAIIKIIYNKLGNTSTTTKTGVAYNNFHLACE